MLSYGGRFLVLQAGIAVAVDLVWVMVFATYLVAAPRPAKKMSVGSTVVTI